MPEWVYPSGIKGSQARSKSPYNQRRKKIGTEQQQPKSEAKQRTPFQADEPEAKPPPPPPAVYGLPGSRPARFAPSSPSTVCPALPLSATVCPFLAGAPPSFVPLSPFLSRSVGSFLRRSPPSAGRVFPRCRCVPVFPRSAGRVFPVLGGVGLPSFSRGRGRGLGFRACVRCRGCCAFRGASVPLDTIRNNSNILSSQKGNFLLWRRVYCAFRGYSAPTTTAPRPLSFLRFAFSAPSSLASARLRPLRLLRPASPAFVLCPPALGAVKMNKERKNYRIR